MVLSFGNMIFYQGETMKLPVGIQSFSEIREDDFPYIDKTGEALELIETF